VIVFALPVMPAVQAEPPKVDFESQAKPILRDRCWGCHGPQKQKGGLRLDGRQAVLDGGNSGPAAVPGKGAESRLVRAVAGLDPDTVMPPDEGKALSAAEVGVLRAWIDGGMPFPDGKSAAVDGPKSSHWSFRPITRPALPGVQDGGWVRNGIDRFVLARLEKDGVMPSPEADRVTVCRRVFPRPDRATAVAAAGR
jgi:hypothetical protein